MSGVGARLAGVKPANGFPAHARTRAGKDARKTPACARRPRNEARKIA
ncbi:conserved hypothetical protein [Burkholderia mallei PRL-20]|nr:hypothetical protein BMASAVP1_A3066 [Burkholderia mallei SAVP1]ABO06737.1 hypothetical protein BMA10247_2257 [Burkholderia mallei NCTC 10247]ACQ95727.1 conserved hypothetical protein [Burkholderia pseudomallei MSHR346]EDK54927.1 hypothetical protein BMAFMH_B0887 [Burkholderia mallei FMH]EDK59898.1 hypothetical protein BMAJHU_B0863 [Burkholderia mallei JHU]EDP87831.1 hypothetical protein BMA10399_I0443 [Burkholderia mallei ATCC 10399]EDU09660.1 hypothetical protein BURPS1655_K1021 [Burkhold